ncbi:MAG: uroporphyrinogen decarboxylase [Kiloniellales bacterium]
MKQTIIPLLSVLRGKPLWPPPLWLMRQAGRYLPEYRALREKAGDFLAFCYSPELAAEATLQPIRRFGLDAAILFSDILTVPDALGQKVAFLEGEGPKLEPLADEGALRNLEFGAVVERLAPVYETLGRVKRELPPGVALIGFAGAPWTVASYMIEGGSSREFLRAKSWAYQAPQSFARLIDLLVTATTEHLLAQAAAGAQALQLFDSWAGIWPEAGLRRWCLEPAREIVQRVKVAQPDIPMILFPRGAGLLYRAFARESGAAALSLDTTVPLRWAREALSSDVVLQGNLDPVLLLSGGKALEQGVAGISAAMSGRRLIFNLGHGVLPQTPPEHVAELVALLRGTAAKVSQPG